MVTIIKIYNYILTMGNVDTAFYLHLFYICLNVVFRRWAMCAEAEGLD